MTKYLVAILLLVSAVSAKAALPSSASYSLVAASLNAGGSKASSASYAVYSAMGEFAAGPIAGSSSTYINQSGFVAQLPPPAAIPTPSPSPTASATPTPQPTPS